MVNPQLKKGVLDMCVLGKIVVKDRYGYDIYQEVSKVLVISESTIYPILRRFVKEELCRTYLKESNTGAPRKYFQITNKGIKRYKALKEDWDEFNMIINDMLRSDLYDD